MIINSRTPTRGDTRDTRFHRHHSSIKSTIYILQNSYKYVFWKAVLPKIDMFFTCYHVVSLFQGAGMWRAM